MNSEKPEDRKSRLFVRVASIVLIVAALLAVIATCNQRKSQKADSASVARAPADVSDFSVVFVNGEAILYWVDSTDAFLDHVEISWDPNGGTPISVDKGTGKYIIPGLQEGVTYNFTVKAADKWGNTSNGRTGGTGKAYKLQRPADASPAEIIGIKGTPVAGQVTLSWTNLADSEYDHIEISYDPLHSAPIRIPKGVQSKTLMGLSNGVEHTFYAVAVDANGNRKPVKELGLFIPDNPTSPESVFGRPISGQITVAWDDPPDPDLDHLEVAYSPDGETLAAVAKGEKSKNIAGLSDGTKYEFTVYAVDRTGHRRPVTGAHLYPAQSDFNDDELTALVTGTPVDGQLKLDWTDPAMARFDHIEIIADPLGEGRSMTVARGVQSHTFSGLSDDEEYSYLVFGIDEEGKRQVIKGVNLSSPTMRLTDEERSAMVSGKPVTGQIRLDWKNPALASFDHLEIVTNPESGAKITTLDKNMQMNNFTGLSDDDVYSFLVYGVDSKGEKRVIHGVKLTTPKPPRITARPVMGEVTLVWDDPDDPNLDLIEVSHNFGGEMPVAVTKGEGTITLSGLSDAREYEFHVNALTTQGISYAMAADVVRPDVIRGTPSDGQLTLEWTDPKDINVDHIEIVYSGGDHLRLATRGMGSQNFTGLNNGQEYSFAVYAVDDTGKRHSIKSAKFRQPEIAPQDDWTPPALIGSLSPLDWGAVDDSTFGKSAISALSFGYTSNRTARWVAGGEDGKMAYSNDYGVTWTAVNDSHFGSFSINTICYANGRWIAGGKNGIMTWSTDAVNWHAINDTYFFNHDLNVNTIIFDNDCWAAGGGDGTIMLSEDDGITWRIAAANAFGRRTADVTSIATHGGRWIAGGTTGEIAWSDDDGFTWTTVSNNILGEYAINVVIYDMEHWFAAGYAQRVAWSNDGVEWRPMARPFYILAMGYNGYRWVAGGQEGRLAWSGDNGVNWNTDTVGRDFFGESWVEAVAFGRSPEGRVRWISAGQSGKMIFADEK